MGRGPKPTKGKAKPAVSRKSAENEDSKVRDIQQRLAEALKRETEALEQFQRRDRELSESQEQQIATAEILRIISSSPTDVQPVLEAVAENAARLCESFDSSIFRRDGDRLLLVAHHGPIPFGRVGEFAIPLTKESLVGRSIIERRAVQVTDLQTETEEFPLGAATARQFGYRTSLAIPLLRESAEIGAISIRRTEVRPFTERQGALLQTFADQAVIAIENVRLFTELQEKNEALTAAHAQVTESLEQQTATSEILRVIASSPTDVQPVFDTIVRSAVLLCGGGYGTAVRFDGELMHLAAGYNYTPEVAQALHEAFPMQPSRVMMSGRAILAGDVVQVEDAFEDPDYSQEVARAGGFRSMLAAPMLRDGRPIGAIVVNRGRPGRFSPTQIGLLKTFADQAVIAIENVRLFTELQASNSELKTALDTQTATADILGVISRSQTEAQPVFEAIVANAVRLCHGNFGAVHRFDGTFLHLVAHHNISGEALDHLRRLSPRPPGKAVRERRVTLIADFETEPEVPEAIRIGARLRGSRSNVTVPMLHGDACLGVIVVGKREPGLFPDEQVQLLRTFADQAVIAIENARLFTELQEKNRALSVAHAQVSESLEQQTATSEILRTISQSPTNLEPTLDTVVRNAGRVCEAYDAVLVFRDGAEVVVRAHWGPIASPLDRRPLTRNTVMGRVILEARPIHVDDLQGADDFPEGKASAKQRGHRTTLAVPLLRSGEAIGSILIRRLEVRPFSTKHIELLQTFADQAVIAIENVRLFTELQEKNQALSLAHAQVSESLEQQTATSEILRVISRSPTDVKPVFDTIVQSGARLCNAVHAVVVLTDGITMNVPANYGRSSPEALAAARAMWPRPLNMTTTAGAAILTRSVVQIQDTEDPSASDIVRQAGRLLGYRSSLAVPMLRGVEAIGAIGVARQEPNRFSDAEVELLKTFADQAVIAIENVRLFKELEVANSELSAASQHKSEFLANMSHELRTPLNAIIGFSEVLSEKMFGDLNEKQEEYSKDIHASGQHLLSLINDILDLSKIEAGRMELELTDFHLPTALDSALTLFRERAARRGIELQMNVDDRLGQIQADERKVRQVVLNLLSNAIKFTPEGGRIEVRATPQDGLVEVSVSDTGVGIAPEDQEAVFEEFRQVGTADKKVEGTGLGLTLCRKFVELHGGKIWVKSELGVGSTFTFTIPMRGGE